jgi:hypothetical protein
MADDRKSFLEAVKTGSATLVTKIVAEITDDKAESLLNSPGCNEDPGSLQGSPLYWACVLGHGRVAQVLLDRGANPDAPATPWGALHIHAACDNNHLFLVRLLLSHGCDVNSLSLQGDTACHLAAFRGNLDMVRLLIEHGTDLQIRNKAGKTVLNEAHAGNHTEVVSYLNTVLHRKALQNGVKRQMSLPVPCFHNATHMESQPVDKIAATLPVLSPKSAILPVTSQNSVILPVSSQHAATLPVASQHLAMLPVASGHSAMLPVTSHHSAMLSVTSHQPAMLPVTSLHHRPKLLTALSCPGPQNSSSRTKSPICQCPDVPYQIWIRENSEETCSIRPSDSRHYQNHGKNGLRLEDSPVSVTNMTESYYDDKSNLYQTKTCV